jgi:hypothetical protein
MNLEGALAERLCCNYNGPRAVELRRRAHAVQPSPGSVEGGSQPAFVPGADASHSHECLALQKYACQKVTGTHAPSLFNFLGGRRTISTTFSRPNSKPKFNKITIDTLWLLRVKNVSSI